MTAKTMNLQTLTFLFFLFWIPSAIVLVLSAAFTRPVNAPIESFAPKINFLTILINNSLVAVLLITLGKIHRAPVYALYYYNAVIFSVHLSVTIERQPLSSVLKQLGPYAACEVLALAIAAMIGISRKKPCRAVSQLYLWCAALLIVSAFFESLAIGYQ